MCSGHNRSLLPETRFARHALCQCRHGTVCGRVGLQRSNHREKLKIKNFAVTTLHETVIAKPLPSNYSAQAAELVALTEACKHATGKCVNIYTDSRYAWGVVHDFGQIWANRSFLTSTGKPVAHHKLVADLLESVLLPKQVAICKCEAHTNNVDSVSQGNARADSAAKTAAKQQVVTSFVSIPASPLTLTADLQDSPLCRVERIQGRKQCGEKQVAHSRMECGLGQMGNLV